MLAARLHGPADLRVERVPYPGAPGRGEALLRVKTTGLCGSDLHSFQDARIGDTMVQAPLILGHEFAGVVEQVGAGALDGNFQPLKVNTRVAVDPAQPCGHCDLCEEGHPHLCRRVQFCGVYPDNGSLCEWVRLPAHCCFPLPKTLDYEEAALLEPLGVAMHAVDLARIKAGNRVAVLGAGPIGLLIVQAVKLAGAEPVFVTERFAWRLNLARRLGGRVFNCDREDVVQQVLEQTEGDGVDVTIEAAWAGVAVQQGAAMLRPGGRLVLVGIPSDDRLVLQHSTARRKGLTIKVVRRLRGTYPRAIRLAKSGRVKLRGLISHRFPLERAAEAFALNASYKNNVVKVIIES